MASNGVEKLSVHRLLRTSMSAAKPKCGYICELGSRKSSPASIEEPYFRVHWVVLQNGQLHLFDSSISQSCSQVISLAGCRLEPALHQDALLWPPWCSQLFTLLSPCGASRQFGCPQSDGWHQEVATATAAAKTPGRTPQDGGIGIGGAVAAAAAAVAAGRAAKENSAVDAAAAAAENPYDSVEPQQQQQQQQRQQQRSLPPPPPPPEEAAVAVNAYADEGCSVYDLCQSQLHALVASGGAASFALDYVAAAVYAGDDVDDAALWNLLEDTDRGTFLLTGFNQKQPSQPMQIVVNTGGHEVKTLPMIVTDDNKVALLADYRVTFGSVEELVFHYHLFPIAHCHYGIGVYLCRAFGYDPNRKLPVRTVLFATSLWSCGDKDLCSRILFESAVGTYSLRASEHGKYVLSVQSQGVVAKLLVNVETASGRTEFFLSSSVLGHARFTCLEDLLLHMHRNKFMLTLDKSRVEMTLHLPYQLSSMCRAKLQSQVLEPLRQRMFHRGSEDQAVAALKLPGTIPGSFIVWLCSASKIVLMASSGANKVEKFNIICDVTDYRHLPQRRFYLEKRPTLCFDSTEALIAHLQWNNGLMAPELRCSLQQPVSRRE